MKIPEKSEWARGARALVDADGKEYFGLRELTEAPARSDDQWHTAVTGERLPGLAWRYYNDPYLWWIIADYAVQDGHRLMHPLRDLTPGMILRIPSRERVLAVLAGRG